MAIEIDLGINSNALALFVEAMRSFWRQESFFVERELRQVLPIGATSQTLRGVTSATNETGLRTYVSGEGGRYSDFIERGRGPGGFPPPSKIRAWLEVTPRGRRFVESVGQTYNLRGEAAISAATFLKGRGIARRGTPAQRVFSNTETKLSPVVEHDLEVSVELAMRKIFS